MFVELIYGFLSNSLGLISDSVHMLIDSSALAIGLYASFVSKLQANETFSFGYERVEVLSGYINGIFLLFVVVEIMSESFERLMNPEKVLPGKMLMVSILGLFINLLGLYFFHDHGHIHSEASDDKKEIQEELKETSSHKMLHHNSHQDTHDCK
jgi:zinc transporter 5/7